MYFNPLYIIAIIIIYLIINTNKINREKYNNKLKKKILNQEKILNKLQNKLDRKKSKSIEKYENEYNNNIKYNQLPTHAQPQIDPVYIRDQMVLNDKLYPPLARTERPQFDLLMNYVNSNNGIFNLQTRGAPDTYRSLGFLTPVGKEQTIDSTLILYGRGKFINSDMGEFYISSSNKMSDIKIPLTEYNSNVRKITDIPTIINITGNMLNGAYNFTELQKATLDNVYM